MAWSGTPHHTLFSSRNLMTAPSLATKVVIRAQICLRSALAFMAACTAVPLFFASSLSCGNCAHCGAPCADAGDVQAVNPVVRANSAIAIARLRFMVSPLLEPAHVGPQPLFPVSG